jgi:hypothetical protein
MIRRITKEYYYTLQSQSWSRHKAFIRVNQAGNEVYYLINIR